LPLGKLHICKVATWENTLGKLPPGKLNICKVATWENTLGKLSLGATTGVYIFMSFYWV